jgi:amino acid transporter
LGKIEDILVYTKVAILLVISGLFLAVGDSSNLSFSVDGDFSVFSVIIVASLTFVAFEGFQLVIHAYSESDDPDRNVPSAIYWAVGVALLIYLALAMGAISAIPQELLIKDKEYALAAGASKYSGWSREVCYCVRGTSCYI